MVEDPGTLVDPSLASPMRNVCYVWVSMGRSTIDGWTCKAKESASLEIHRRLSLDTLGENVTGNSRVFSPTLTYT